MDLIQLTRELVAIDSTTGREGEVGRFVADLLERRGWTVQRQAVEGDRINVYATRGTPVVVFSTHLDTVPPYIPLREEGGTLHGRGTCDAKGLAAAMIVAAERLVASGETRVGLLFLVGEENGSDGAKLACRLGPKGKWLINGEPTEGKLSVGQKGVLRADVVATGKAAHSAYPEEGQSAIVALLETVRRIRRLAPPFSPVLGPTTLNIGLISGGVAPNVIPAHARATLLFRTVAAVEPLKQAVLATADPIVDITFPLEIPSVVSDSLPGWDSTTVSYASDLPFLADWGTGYQLGPGTIRVAHTDHEHIGKAELEAGMLAYERLARE
ncbi:MAG TPA: M20/M25/M40 family metallo-hydrolase, partial [Gemmatimonadales bacterium]|nr:M20/M25/M40 family metallo-hydrolase [Gemmatimonadales bacterium]